MRPIISNTATRRLTIPEMSGGVNYRDGISLVKDNQLTDCRNVWYKGGILRTRPGIAATSKDEQVTEYYDNTDNVRVYAKKENFRVIGGETYFLSVVHSKGGLKFTYYPENSAKPPIEIAYIPSHELPKDENFTCNIFQHNADIYCFCSGYYEGEATPYYIFKIYKGDIIWQYSRITDDDLYIPTVMTNGKPIMRLKEIGTGVSKEALAGYGADFIEGYNLLGHRYKMVYSMANDKDSAEGTDHNYMCYQLLHKVKGLTHAYDQFVGKEVIATYTSISGYEYTHKVTITNNWFGDYEKDEDLPADNLRLAVFENQVAFYPKDSTDKVMLWSKDDFVRNNMTIIAPAPNTRENYEKVLNMTESEWFGGGAEGIYGGIHLFMGGNTKQDEKALVCWSDVKEPLYFSENCYAYAGDKSQGVTAFGKQGDSLVIFKERETYMTKYANTSSNVTADAVINQSVVDVTATEVIFPMTQVHSFIGCDCPDTVQLCRNRLVWAHSDGKVYTLANATQWNERSIFEVSDMIEPKLREISKLSLKNSISADYEGHYILCVGDKMFLMDYNSYGYAHVSSYLKNEDAQLNIPWWIWETPKYPRNANFTDSGILNDIVTEEKRLPILSMVTVGNSLYLWAEVETQKGPSFNMTTYFIPELFVVSGEDDIVADIKFESDSATSEQFRIRENVTREIPAMAQTKLFDFGAPTIKKAVPKTDMSFGNNDGVPVMVTTITNNGESGQEIVPNGEETNDRQPAFFETVVIRNSERLSERIGYRLESNGNIALGGISLTYKIIGGKG